jgi:thiazole synthase ThiGH ThiG subunit
VTIPAVLDAGDGVTIKREAALGAARHVIAATAIALDQDPIDEMGLDLATSNLAYLLGGDHWFGYANALIEVVEKEMER